MTSKADSLLLFGATGDLSVRYLFPSLVHLLRDRLLPPDFQVVAVGRQDYDVCETVQKGVRSKYFNHGVLTTKDALITSVNRRYLTARGSLTD